MSLCKLQYEYRTILDFSEKNVSRNLVRTSLTKTEVLGLHNIESELMYIENEIKIGMYRIRLLLSKLDAKHLREYGSFKIKIYQADSCINLHRDKRFNIQPWVDKNEENNLRVKDLVDVILYCNRLNNLSSFL